MNAQRRSELEGLAREILSREGQQGIQDRLDDGDEKGAMYYLLGALDHSFKDGMDEGFAAGYYKILGVDPEQASVLRQASGKF